MKTASSWRRAVSVCVDTATVLLGIGFGYALGAFDGSVFRPDAGWFWTEWALKYWLDAPETFTRPLLAWAVLGACWVLGWELASGRTPGDRLAGIEVVDRDGSPPHPARMALRAVGVALNLTTLGLGWMWGLVSPSRRALHDLVSGTAVTRSEN